MRTYRRERHTQLQFSYRRMSPPPLPLHRCRTTLRRCRTTLRKVDYHHPYRDKQVHYRATPHQVAVQVARAKDLGDENKGGELGNHEGEDTGNEGDENKVGGLGGVHGVEGSEMASCAVAYSYCGEGKINYA